MVWLAAKAPITQAAILLGLFRYFKRPAYGRMMNALRQAYTLNGKLDVAVRYAKIECAPPKVGELSQLGARTGELFRGVANIKNYTLGELTVRALIAWEIAMWYFFGEMIGRANIRGYRSRIPYVQKEAEMFHTVASKYDERLANI